MDSLVYGFCKLRFVVDQYGWKSTFPDYVYLEVSMLNLKKIYPTF